MNTYTVVTQAFGVTDTRNVEATNEQAAIGLACKETGVSFLVTLASPAAVETPPRKWTRFLRPRIPNRLRRKK